MQCVIFLTLPFPELQEGFTDTTTPWHSDEAYWLDLADKRALSFWFPMQDVNVSKGVLPINSIYYLSVSVFIKYWHWYDRHMTLISLISVLHPVQYVLATWE